ncbi:MAG: hypothetical protein WC222_00960 [Parachlamydiales bacterium]
MKLRNLFVYLMLMASVTAPTQVMGWFWDNCNSCCETVDPCCYQGPLCEGGWSILAKGGIDPIHWTERGKVWLTVPAAVPAVFSVSRTAKFRNQFELPYIVGGEIAYNLSDNAQLFVEANYIHGKGKTFNFIAGTFVVSEVNDDYEAWSGYIGGRYYFSRSWICDRVSPFVGLKAGFVNHRQVKYGLSLFGTFIEKDPYYVGKSGVSAGVQLGFDILITDALSAVLNLEAVASQGPRANRNNEFDPVLTGGLTNVNIGQVGTEVSFPITLGLRYTF